MRESERLTLLRSSEFITWLDNLKDKRSRVVISERLGRVADGNLGLIRGLNGGLFELKVDFGPGYRIYCARRGQQVIILLCGGDKSSQSRDIGNARAMLAGLREQDHDD